MRTGHVQKIYTVKPLCVAASGFCWQLFGKMCLLLFQGFVWAKNVNTNPHWEVELTFKVSGRGRVGADGLVRSEENQT